MKALDGSTLCIMASSPLSIERIFAEDSLALDPDARAVGQAMIDLIHDREPRDSIAKEAALGLMRWAFGNHTMRMRPPRFRESGHCSCGACDLYRRIFTKYSVLFSED